MADHRPARLDRLLAALLLGLPVLVVLAATFVTNGATRIYTWPWAFYVQAAMLAPWFWCAWQFVHGRTGLRAGWWISLPLLGALALSVATSAHWHDALEASLVLATPVLLLPHVAAMWSAASAHARLVSLRCTGAVFGALALSGLATYLASAPDSGVLGWFLTQRNPHPLGHWNYTGGLALLALPVTVLLVSMERGMLRAAWGVVSLAVCIQFLSAGSRGAVLGLLAALMLAGVVLAARRRWTVRSAVIGIATLAVLGAALVATNPRLRRAVADPASVLEFGESEQQRRGFILTGVRIGAAHPWTGIGPGTTPYHYPEHRVDLLGSLENSFQLHCGPIQAWVDLGYIGLAALAFAGGWLARHSWRARRTLSNDGIAALAILGGYGTMWLTDYQLDTPIFPIVLLLAAAVLIAESTGAAAAPLPRTRLTGLALLTAPVICAILLLPAWRARAAFAEAWSAKDSNDPSGFIKNLRAAAETAPWHPYYQNHFARALAGIADHLPPETAASLRSEAREAWQHSLAIAPAQDHPWINLGWLALNRGETSAAAECFSHAAAIQPRRTGLWFGTGLAQFALGQSDAAARSLASEVRLDPGFVTSPLWWDEPFTTLRRDVLILLATGWPAHERDPGAAGAADIAAFARWWWTGNVEPEAVSSATSPIQQFLQSLPRLNDRTVAEVAALPPALRVLREHWRTGAPIESPLVPSDLAALWTAHVIARPTDAFSLLLRTFPATANRRIQRGADGILFRQLDGDPLSDLTEIPASQLVRFLGLIVPHAAMEEFYDRAPIRRNSDGSTP